MERKIPHRLSQPITPWITRRILFPMGFDHFVAWVGRDGCLRVEPGADVTCATIKGYRGFVDYTLPSHHGADPGDNRCVVRYILVAEDERGCGLGTRLMLHVGDALARVTGDCAASIELDDMSTPRPSRLTVGEPFTTFYTDLGFKPAPGVDWWAGPERFASCADVIAGCRRRLGRFGGQS